MDTTGLTEMTGLEIVELFDTPSIWNLEYTLGYTDGQRGKSPRDSSKAYILGHACGLVVREQRQKIAYERTGS